MPYLRILLCVLLLIPTDTSHSDENWPQAFGPQLNWKLPQGTAPTKWSVVREENIVWKTTLPEGGQSSITVWGDKAFLTCHKELKSDADIKTSTDIVGYCLNADTGQILWRVDIPGSVAVGTAGIFSDATVFAPITDGKHVWFFNRSGAIACFTFEGKQVWLREYRPRNRHTNRQCEPILFGDQIITVEVADKDKGALIGRHKPVPSSINQKDVWTFLHGRDKSTGKVLWREAVGTVIHHTPSIGFLESGLPAIVHARGGAHQPLETPAGLSLTSIAPGREGNTLWSASLPKLDPPFNSHWNEKHVYAFHNQDHIVLDTKTGAELSRRNLNEDVSIWRRAETGWMLEKHASVKAGRKHANTNQTNIVVGDWHYFLAHDIIAIGRVNVLDGRVEYLEVPVQIDSTPEQSNLIWQKERFRAIETNNSRGINLAADKRASRHGWGHVSAASPILVDRFLYFPIMNGTVYVIDAEAERLDDKALIAINDLGQAGKTWTLSQFSYAKKRLFIRTMKEAICIGTNE